VPGENHQSPNNQLVLFSSKAENAIALDYEILN
jgi:hypothetical protein